MDITDYIRVIRKYFWLVLLGAVVFGGVTYYQSGKKTPVYTAQATIAIGSYIQSPNPDSGEIRIGFDLAQTYAELATSYNVLQGTIDALDLWETVSVLRGRITTRVIQQTSLVVIEVTHPNRVLVASIANEVAQQLITKSPTNLTPEQQAQIDLAEEEVSKLSTTLAIYREEFNSVNAELLESEDPEEILNLRTRRDLLSERISDLSDTMSSYTATIATLQQRRNSLEIVEVAQVPAAAEESSDILTIIIGTMLGGGLVVGLVLVKEFLVNAPRTSREIAELLGTPVLGVIPRIKRSRGDTPVTLLDTKETREFAAEAYRTLQANLLLATIEKCQLYLVTSPGPSEGKTTTTVNLGVSIAVHGQRVLMIDADLLNPTIHEVFKLDNDVGIKNYLAAKSPGDKGEAAEKPTLGDLVQDTSIPNLAVIACGTAPDDTIGLLEMGTLQAFFNMLSSSEQYDIILVDTPPCLLVPDSQIIAQASGAHILLVLEAGRTQRGTAQKASERFALAGQQLRGIVLNNSTALNEDFYGNEKLRSYYKKRTRTSWAGRMLDRLLPHRN